MAIQSKPRAGEATRVTVSFSDSINLVKKQVQWSPKGVCLLTKWPFQVGAEVEFAFDHESERHCCTGVVVACHPLRRPLGLYETVLYFVETPCSELQKAASACRLSPEQLEAQEKDRESTAVHASEEASLDDVPSAVRGRSAHSRR
jgi:hypothetical protein